MANLYVSFQLDRRIALTSSTSTSMLAIWSSSARRLAVRVFYRFTSHQRQSHN